MKPYLVNEYRPELDEIERRPRELLHRDQPGHRPQAQGDDGQRRRPRHASGRRSRASRSAARPAPRRPPPGRPPYAWFISFAPADDPEIAVAVLVQDAGIERDAISGGDWRADRQAVMEAVMSRVIRR